MSVRSTEPAAIPILAQRLGIKMWDDLIKDFGCPILDGAQHAEPHTAGDAAPGAILHPRLAFEGLLAFDLALAQWTYWEASALGGAPPAGTGEGKAPQDGFVFIEHNDLATTSLVLKGGEFERAVSEISRGGIKATSGTIVAYLLFLTPRGRFRGSPARQSGGPRRSRVPDNSTGNGAHHVGGGPAIPGKLVCY